MAGLASFDADSRVFKEERPALVDVAFQTRLFIRLRLIDHTGTHTHAPGRRVGAVGIVAIRALDDSLVHTMLERHVELCADLRMAGVAEVRLIPREQEFRRSGTMDRMAVRANHIGERVG